MPVDLPNVVWFRIAKYTARHRESYDVDLQEVVALNPAGKHSWREGDLVSLMRVNRSIYHAVAPYLYRFPIVDDLAAFFASYTLTQVPETQHCTSEHVSHPGAQLISKTQLLQYVRTLHLTLPPAKDERDILLECRNIVRAILALNIPPPGPVEDGVRGIQTTEIIDEISESLAALSISETNKPLDESQDSCSPLLNLEIVTLGRYPYRDELYSTYHLAVRGSPRPAIISITQTSLFYLLKYLHPKVIHQHIERGPLAFCFHPDLRHPLPDELEYDSFREAQARFPWKTPSGSPDQIFETHCIPVILWFPVVYGVLNRWVIQYDFGERSIYDNRTEESLVTKLSLAISVAVREFAEKRLNPGGTKVEIVNLACPGQLRRKIWAKSVIYQRQLAINHPLPVVHAARARRIADEAELRMAEYDSVYRSKEEVEVFDEREKEKWVGKFWEDWRSQTTRLAAIGTSGQVKINDLLQDWKSRISLSYDHA